LARHLNPARAGSRSYRKKDALASRCQASHDTSMLLSVVVTTSASTVFSTLGAHSRGLRAPCVRFAAPVARTPRNTRFRLVASLCRAGLVTRRDAQRVSEFTARASHPPSPGFAWRNTTFDNISPNGPLPDILGKLASASSPQSVGDESSPDLIAARVVENPGWQKINTY
jgi:hypothetical protein